MRLILAPIGPDKVDFVPAVCDGIPDLEVDTVTFHLVLYCSDSMFDL